MKLIIAFLFGLSVFAVACSQAQLSPTPQTPRVTASPTIKIPHTATPTAAATPTRTAFPTRTPIPLTDLYLQNPKLITDPELAIAYSHNLLILRGYEQGFSYDNALFTPVEFLDGARGAFVALGFGGPAHGYKLLYRVEADNTFRLVQMEDSFYEWGMDFGNRETTFDEKVGLSFPELVFDANGEPEHLIELTGSAHQGTGLWSSGYFEILKIADTGAYVIFSDTHFEAVFGHQGDHKVYRYEYVDLDGDWNKEIVKTGTECKLYINANSKTDCKNIHEIYKYNGEEYVKQP